MQPVRNPRARRGVLVLLGAALPLFITISSISAETPATGTIAVTAPAPVVNPAPEAGRSVLTGEEIEASGAATVAEALATLPGVTVTTAGAPGAIATISIRGSTSNQVLVVVDGAPATDPATGLTDFSRLGLAPEDIVSVEVLRGGASAQYGADAVGGVILIKTKKTAAAAGPVFEVGFSNLFREPFAAVEGTGLSALALAPDPAVLADGQDLSLRLELPTGFALSAGGERKANEYLYIDANGQKRRRENAGLLSGRAAASWKGAALGGSLEGALGGFARELGVPGPIDAPTPDANERDAQLRGSLHYSTDAFLSDRVALDSSLFGLYSRTAYRSAPALSEDTNAALRAGIDTRASILVAEGDTIGSGFAARYDRLDSSNVKSVAGAVPERLSLGFYAEPSVVFAGWTLAPAGRLDWTSDFGAGMSASFGAARALAEALTLSLNASTAYRAPSFNDLYWPAADGAQGDPGLRPETAYGADLGLRFSEEDASFSATGYLRYTKDVILWQPGSDGIWRPSNFGAALYPGFELEGALKLSGPLSATLAYTFLHSYLLSGGVTLAGDRRVPMVPEQAFELGFGYSKKPLEGRLRLSYKGLRYLGTTNVAYDPAHLVVDAHLACEIGGASTLEFDAENLLDERYQSVQGYPMPGVSLRVSWRLRLGASK